MGTYTQANRPFRITSALGEDVLLLAGFSGTEGVSKPFAFSIDLLSEDSRIDCDGLLGKPLAIEMDLPNGEVRYIHGLVRRFSQLGRDQGLVSYRAEVVPWLWFLSLAYDCRIFQHKSVPQIAEAVFKEAGFTDFAVRCSASYQPREYCVQYRESDLAFVSRLLEEEGIFFFFEHTDKKHTLVLADSPSAIKPVPHQSKVDLVIAEGSWFDNDVITELSSDHAVHTGKVTIRNYDPLQPSLNLEGSVSGKERAELYDYPVNFTKLDDGNRYARLQLEQLESERQRVAGAGNTRSLVPGFKFDLRGHYRSDANRSYMLLSVSHQCSTVDYRGGGAGEYHYRNVFEAMPNGAPFRPPRETPRPIVHGSQTAVVVGPGGEEIHVDKHARVKVQFYWDRLGKKDDKSSCWVRVSSTWAGKGWGFIQIPRIGQEVLVDFLEGDPDQPIIVGRVYNAEQVPPFPLPAEQNKSGVQSRSTKGGAAANFNQISFDDTKGAEEFYLHAEKDERHEVENDRERDVGHDESVAVKNDQSISVEHDRSRDVGNNETVAIEKNQSISVGVDQTISVDANRSKTVGKNESTDIGGNRSENVGKNESITIGGNRTESVAKNEQVDVSEKREVSIGKDDLLNVGKKLGMIVADEIMLKTGDASITMKKDGTIIIKGKDIKLDGSGKITVKASGDVVMKGSKVTAN
ncbi:MAG: type VI secretion system tip protein TssI/VgrG [Gemmatimonadaceae bacterium]|nr:type VI secretion system tip protein TssI/VgrG [Gemmatimonadaceae bacterium]